MKIFLPIITYNRTCNTDWMLSVMQLVLFLGRKNVQVVLFPITFESLISRARNGAVANFLAEKSCTHILFIDSDIVFKAEDVMRLLESDKDVIGAAYSKKYLDFNLMKHLAEKQLLQTPKDLELCGNLSVILSPDTKPGLVMECEYLTTGFLLVKRNVFEQIAEKHPELKYVNDIDGYANEGAKELFYDFFQVRVHPESRRLESEDYGFCRLWRHVGGKVHVLTDVSLTHVGHFGYVGNMYSQLNFMQNESNKKEETK